MIRARGIVAVTTGWALGVVSFGHAQTFNLTLSVVPGGGVGPAYTFKAGKFKVFNSQYASFLNDAQLDAGATGRSSNMVFLANGEVQTPGGAVLFKPFPSSRIIYGAGSPVGFRYNTEAGYSDHPVTAVSWIGAVKFCNWLTIDQELGEAARTYTEGANIADWHPATISAADWAARDLDDGERQALVNDYLGFRLPMENVGSSVDGWVSSPENQFNERYKMAAHDPAAPDTFRSGPGDETISPDHWIYGFGRDTITGSSANYLASGDPFEFGGTTPSGFYNGSNGGTLDTSNPYRIYDLSGNVREWCQDHSSSLNQRVLHGGAWTSAVDLLVSTHRVLHAPDYTANDVGFRVVVGVPPPPAPDGDYDGNGIVNLADHAAFPGCMDGPGVAFDTDGLMTRTVNVGPGFSFSPVNLTIEVGDTVHWDWGGGTHNVTSGLGGIHDGNFYSGPATSNSSFFFDVTFDEDYLVTHPMTDNVYPYYCEPHFGFGMIGSVNVNYDPCFVFDFDRDQDVDMIDFAGFQDLFGDP